MGLRMPVRTAAVELDGDYAGFTFEVRRNFKAKTLDAFANAGSDFPAARKALAGLLVTWNFCDENGEPLPQPTAEGDVLGELPLDLLNIMVGKTVEAVAQVPNPSKPS